MAVHCGAGVWPVLPRIGKLPRHHAAKFDVLTAAAPLPALARQALVPAAAATDGRRALSARACHSEGHAGRGDGVHKGRLPRGCGERRPGWQAQQGLGARAWPVAPRPLAGLGLGPRGGRAS